MKFFVDTLRAASSGTLAPKSLMEHGFCYMLSAHSFIPCDSLGSSSNTMSRSRVTKLLQE
jgi:hypothetical protein